MESVPIDWWKKNQDIPFVQYSLSTDKATVSPYFGFSYMSSETEIKFFYLGLLDLNDENTSKLAKKNYSAVWHCESWDFRKGMCGKGLGKRKKSLKLQR